MKSYQEYLFEATQERMGQIKLSSTGGGLAKPMISYEMNRNPEATGTFKLELYNKQGVEYTFYPTPELKAQMDIRNGATGTDDESLKEAEANIQKILSDIQDEISADFLQLFTRLDEDIMAILEKHNIKK